jgi:hypothetical protein
MKPSTYARLIFAALPLAALAACAPATQLTSSWADPTAPSHQFHKMCVVGLTPKSATRRMYEDDFVAELKTRRLAAVQSYTFGIDGQMDKDAAAGKLQEAGVDGVIVTRLIDKESVQTYYPPTYSTMGVPPSYYGGWYGYYSAGYTYMSSPGYVAEDHVFRIETNVYDLQAGKLMWSGLTETTLSSDSAPETEIKPFIALIVADMEKHKVLPKKK